MGKKYKKDKSEWHSAVCYNAVSMAKSTREILEQLGYKFERERSYKAYSKLMVVFPLPRYSYVFQFKVKEPAEFIINIYDTKPTPSGELHLLEILKINKENKKYVKNYLRTLKESLPRKPWQFFWSERLRYAIAAPEYLRAKKAWREMEIE
jgi:hypothetical protein